MVREISPVVSNWRATLSLPDWLAQHGVPGISGIDTRFLTRKLRDQGTLKAALSTRGTPGRTAGRNGARLARPGWARYGPGSHLRPGHPLAGRPRRQLDHPTVPAPGVSPAHRRSSILAPSAISCATWPPWACAVTIVPAYTTCEQALALQPDGILLSNGPGDPAGLPRIVSVVRELIDSGLPIFGICLGHQLIGRASAARRIGSSSATTPATTRCRICAPRKVQVTSQNHNYAVATDSLDPAEVEVTHLSLNDRTLEGLRLKNRPVFSVQYHPEAAPGPHDAHGLFAEFYIDHDSDKHKPSTT